jgi:Translation initiation factor IF-2, N-terminal region
MAVARVRVRDLAQRMGRSNEEVMFQLRALGAHVTSPSDVLEPATVQALITGEQVGKSGPVVGRSKEVPRPRAAPGRQAEPEMTAPPPFAHTFASGGTIEATVSATMEACAMIGDHTTRLNAWIRLRRKRLTDAQAMALEVAEHAAAERIEQAQEEFRTALETVRHNHEEVLRTQRDEYRERLAAVETAQRGRAAQTLGSVRTTIEALKENFMSAAAHWAAVMSARLAGRYGEAGDRFRTYVNTPPASLAAADQKFCAARDRLLQKRSATEATLSHIEATVRRSDAIARRWQVPMPAARPTAGERLPDCTNIDEAGGAIRRMAVEANEVEERIQTVAAQFLHRRHVAIAVGVAGALMAAAAIVWMVFQVAR